MLTMLVVFGYIGACCLLMVVGKAIWTIAKMWKKYGFKGMFK